MKDGSHDLLGMLSCVRRLFSWPRRFLQSSSFFPEKLQFDINSRRFLSFLYNLCIAEITAQIWYPEEKLENMFWVHAGEMTREFKV